MKYTKKIKAGALQFVLLVGTLIAVLLMAFVLLHQSHVFFGKKTSKTIAVIKKADLGLDHAIGQDVPLNDSLALEVDLDDNIGASVHKSFWGVFEKYIVVSKFGKTRFVKKALVGGSVDDDFSALYLKDNDRPMIIAGSAKITGNAYLPKQGIRPGTIGGRFYEYASPIYGNVKSSSRKLPSVPTALENHLKQVLSKDMNEFEENRVRFLEGMVLANSFESPTQIIYGDILNLSSVDLRGNIMVKASQRIMVNKNSYLKDVVLIAPKIDIAKGFKGTLQCIASESIAVEEDVILEYPSALIVDRGTRSNLKKQSEPNIQIGKHALIKGIVAYLEKSNETNFSPQISVEENAVIFGEIHCAKNLELKGSVMGHVSTDAFIAMENGSVYQNHLFNGTIDATKLPAQYGGLVLDSEKTVVKWLY